MAAQLKPARMNSAEPDPSQPDPSRSNPSRSDEQQGTARSFRGTFEGPLAAAWRGDTGKDALLRILAGGRERLTIHQAAMQGGWSAVGAAPVAALASEAEADRGTPWPQPLLSHYARYFRDGNRTAYEGLVAARQQRLTRAVVMACLAQAQEPVRKPAGEPGTSAVRQEWLDEVIDGAYLLCEQSSWCWAAHEDAYTRRGDVVPDRSAPYLDLGAGEVAAQLAWLDLVLAEQLDQRAPGLRRRIREEVLDRVVRPFLDRDDWHWLGLDGDVHNWNPWIHSNVIAAALSWWMTLGSRRKRWPWPLKDWTASSPQFRQTAPLTKASPTGGTVPGGPLRPWLCWRKPPRERSTRTSRWSANSWPSRTACTWATGGS